MMVNAGIDINVYKPNSVRSAAASKAKANNSSLAEIMQIAWWSSAAPLLSFMIGRLNKAPRLLTAYSA